MTRPRWRKSSHSNPSGNCVEIFMTDPVHDLDAVRRQYPDWRLYENEDGSLTAVRIGDHLVATAQTAIGLMTRMDAAAAGEAQP
jgi:Domain of unknown function (DUF397)